MSITASQVKELREKTGVGMMDCKKALLETNGDFEKAMGYLREKGLAKASKKSDRSTNEGQVFISLSASNDQAVIVEVSCETDFVAKNERFKIFGQTLSDLILAQSSISSIDLINNLDCNGTPFETFVSQYVMELGENLSVTRFDRITDSYVASYVHMNGKIGTLVHFSNTIDSEVAKGIAMQVAATQPLSISSDDLPQDTLASERQVIRQQVLNEGKPEAIVDKIVDGKIGKYFKEVCLLEQSYVKDADQTIKSLLPDSTSINGFTRYAIG